MSVDIINVLIGAISALLIPTVTFFYRSHKKRSDFKKVKKMIFSEYISPIEELTDTLTAKTYAIYSATIMYTSQRLDYLLNDEVKYMNSENQFAIIRLIEYTKIYLKAVSDILNAYTFVGPEPSASHSEEVEKKGPKIKIITQKYKQTIDDYINLKIDRFPKDKK